MAAFGFGSEPSAQRRRHSGGEGRGKDAEMPDSRGARKGVEARELQFSWREVMQEGKPVAF